MSDNQKNKPAAKKVEAAPRTHHGTGDGGPRVKGDAYSQMQEALELLTVEPAAGMAVLKGLADTGSVEAMINIGVSYQTGQGKQKDLRQAEIFYRRALDSGADHALFYLGSMFVEEKDFEKAVAMFAEGAACGDKDCNDQLEKLKNWRLDKAEYDEIHRIILGQKTNGAKALTELKALAERHSLRAMVALGWAYRKGVGTSVDLGLANAWYGRAQNESTGSGDVDKEVAYKSGVFYIQQHQYEKAYSSFERGAMLGHVGCLRMLARMYVGGLGVERDPNKGREYLERAVLGGSVFAKRDLARLLMAGPFGWRNRMRGLYMLMRALREGFLIACQNPNDQRLKE